MHIGASGTTTATPDGHPPPVLLQPSPDVVRRDDKLGRNPSRLFLGPMPERVIAAHIEQQHEHKLKRRIIQGIHLHSREDAARVDGSATTASARVRRKWTLRRRPAERDELWEGSSSSDEDSADDFIDDVDSERAFRFFLSRGGKREEWTEEANRSARSELVRRWRNSAWAKVRANLVSASDKQRRAARSSTKWAGESFVVNGHLSLPGCSPSGSHTDSVDLVTALPPPPSLKSNQPDTTPSTTAAEASSSRLAVPDINPNPISDILSPAASSPGPSSADFVSAKEYQSSHLPTPTPLQPTCGSESSNNNDNGRTGDYFRLSAASTQPILSAPLENGNGNGNGKYLQSTSSPEVNLSGAPELGTPDRVEGSSVAPRSENDLAKEVPSKGLRSAFARSSRIKGKDKDKGKGKARAVTFQDDLDLVGNGLGVGDFTDSPLRLHPNRSVDNDDEDEEDVDDEHPTSAGEVLQRHGRELKHTSAGATQSHLGASGEGGLLPGSVLRRERMYVRVSHTHQDVRYYDEENSRVVTDLKSERWAEYLVVWRRRRLELYENHTLPGKEAFLGRKHLAYVIPLRWPATRFSLYSFTDMSFCLMAPVVSFSLGVEFGCWGFGSRGKKDGKKAKLKFAREEEEGGAGTQVFVFKHKRRKVGVEWAWRLWYGLGGKIPASIDVHIHIPMLPSAKVRIDIPQISVDGEEGWTSMHVERVLEIVKESMSSLGSGSDGGGGSSEGGLISALEGTGRELALAWRRGGILDWIWNPCSSTSSSVSGVGTGSEDWSVLWGFVMRSSTGFPTDGLSLSGSGTGLPPGIGMGQEMNLEARLGEFMPTQISLADGAKLKEPPSIEGFLWRLRPRVRRGSFTSGSKRGSSSGQGEADPGPASAQSRSLVYFATHNGYIFSLAPSKAQEYLPDPPSAPDDVLPIAHQHLEEGNGSAESTSVEDEVEKERMRGTRMILDADAVFDLRNIIVVRRAERVVVAPSTSAQLPTSSTSNTGGPGRPELEQAEEEEEELVRTISDDEDEGGDVGLSKAADGDRCRIRRRVELVMRSGNILQLEAHSRNVALDWIRQLRKLVSYWTRRHRVDARQEMELQRAVSGQARFDSRKILRYGKDLPPERPPDVEDVSHHLSSFWNWTVLLAKRSIIRSGRTFLQKGIRGQFKLMQMCLISGHIVFFHIKQGNTLNAFHRSRTVNLLDTYVTSGKAALETISSYAEEETHFARRYQDGLECNDPAQDTLFIIWYRKLGKDHKMHQRSDKAPPPPNLGAKRKAIVLKTRSKLERDAWCWAINMEIDRIAESQSEREEAARNTGGVAQIHR